MEVRVRDQFAIDKARFEKLRFICKASEFPAIQRSKLTYDKFKWALCMVRSRFVSSFDQELAQMDISWLKLGTPYDSGALCPYFDMINHSTEDCNAKYYYTVNFGMTVRATRDILSGDQIFISYSNRSDDDLFMSYGFCQSPGSNKNSS